MMATAASVGLDNLLASIFKGVGCLHKKKVESEDTFQNKVKSGPVEVIVLEFCI